MATSFDLIVLGGGSGGLAAAKRAAGYGARVALIEGDRVGGTCVIRGCVPKKLLVYGSLYRQYLENASSYGVNWSNAKQDTNILLSNVRKEVDRLNDLHTKLLAKADIELVSGWGSFISPNEILVKRNQHDQEYQELLNGKRILIAVGGRPDLPDIPGVELGWVSDDMFLQSCFPEKVVVLGGGYIACEFACILNGLGSQVVQLVRGPHLLRGFDRELSSALLENMQRNGVEVHLNIKLTSIEGELGKLLVRTSKEKLHKCNGVLIATGRKPFLEGLNLKAAGVKDSDERINVDIDHRTNVRNIYAIGDVTNKINLTPVAIEEGRNFADNTFGKIRRHVDYNFVASAVFSQPEIATVGLTEDQAISNYGKDQIKVFRSRFRPMSKALPKTEEYCILKLIINLKNQKIVGCHMLGEHAAEIIQMASIAIRMGATKSDFDRTMALHPTISEEFVTMT